MIGRPEFDLLVALCVPESKQRRRLGSRERRDITDDGALYFDGKRYPTVRRLWMLGLVDYGGNLYAWISPTPRAWRYLGLDPRESSAGPAVDRA
jgi:hypothetical protein